MTENQLSTFQQATHGKWHWPRINKVNYIIIIVFVVLGDYPFVISCGQIL